MFYLFTVERAKQTIAKIALTNKEANKEGNKKDEININNFHKLKIYETFFRHVLHIYMCILARANINFRFKLYQGRRVISCERVGQRLLASIFNVFSAVDKRMHSGSFVIAR